MPNVTLTDEPREPDEVAIALNAIPRPHPTDPSIIQYERNGTVIAWHRVAAREQPKERP